MTPAPVSSIPWLSENFRVQTKRQDNQYLCTVILTGSDGADEKLATAKSLMFNRS